MNTESESNNRNLVLTRVFDAPRELVFKAWTDPQQMARWWGPRAFTNPVCELDVRAGGAMVIHMRAPDGTVYPCTGVFQEVVPPEKLVFTSAASDGKGGNHLEVLNTVTFVESGGKTTLTLHAQVQRSTARGDEMLKGQKQGWSQSLEKLGELLTDDRVIVSSRLIHAPRELVFRAWMEPEQLRQWWGPNGFTNTFQEFNPQPGGAWRHTMHGPGGQDFENESVIVEIAEPERIVFDHLKTMVRFRMTMTYEDQNGNTLLTWRMCFDTAAECERIRPMATQGNEQNFDRLEAHLKKMEA